MLFSVTRQTEYFFRHQFIPTLPSCIISSIKISELIPEAAILADQFGKKFLLHNGFVRKVQGRGGRRQA